MSYNLDFKEFISRMRYSHQNITDLAIVKDYSIIVDDYLPGYFLLVAKNLNEMKFDQDLSNVQKL